MQKGIFAALTPKKFGFALSATCAKCYISLQNKYWLIRGIDILRTASSSYKYPAASQLASFHHYPGTALIEQSRMFRQEHKPYTGQGYVEGKYGN